jgi:hypothetical protein
VHRLDFRHRTNAKCMQPNLQPGCNANDMPFSTPFQLRQRRERGFPTRLGRYILLKKANVVSFVFHRNRRPAGASAAGWRCPPERAHRPQLAYAGTGNSLACAHSPPRSGDATGRKCFGRRLYCHSRSPAALGDLAAVRRSRRRDGRGRQRGRSPCGVCRLPDTLPRSAGAHARRSGRPRAPTTCDPLQNCRGSYGFRFAHRGRRPNRQPSRSSRPGWAGRRCSPGSRRLRRY